MNYGYHIKPSSSVTDSLQVLRGYIELGLENVIKSEESVEYRVGHGERRGGGRATTCWSKFEQQNSYREIEISDWEWWKFYHVGNTRFWRENNAADRSKEIYYI